MKTKDIIYKIIANELKAVDDKSFIRRSALLNFTNTIKKKIENKLGEHYETQFGPKHHANKNNGKSSYYFKKSAKSAKG